jgi:hypothetical protein
VHIEGLPFDNVLPPHIDPVLSSDKYAHKVESYLSEMLQECSAQVLGYETLCNNLLMSLITLICRLADVKYGFQTL